MARDFVTQRKNFLSLAEMETKAKTKWEEDKKSKKLYQEYIQLKKIAEELQTDYAKQHPENLISPYLLLKCSNDTIRKYYNRFPQIVKDSPYGRKLRRKYVSNLFAVLQLFF